ncbi:response regulator [Candidatus Halobeggiatoa sp. HSG11]|nr:response regulator [Candidatus Halobeggiatoa sp. HSG11]
MHDQLNLWPHLILEYLLSPESGTKDIVAYICKNNWPIIASKKHANYISVQLVKDYAVGIIETKNVKPSIKPASKDSQENKNFQEIKKTQENKTSIQEIASELSSKQIEQAINADKMVTSETEAPKNSYTQLLNESEIFDITALIKDDLPLIAGSLDIASDIEALTSDAPKQAFNSNAELPILPVMSSISAIEIDDDIMDSDDMEQLVSGMEKNFDTDEVVENEELSVENITIEDTNINDIANIEIPTMEEFENNIENSENLNEDTVQISEMDNLETELSTESTITLDNLDLQDDLVDSEETLNELPDSAEPLKNMTAIPDFEDDLINSEDSQLEEIPEIITDDSLDLPETIPDLQDDLLEATIQDEIISDDESLEEQEPQISIDNSLDLPETIPDLQDDLSEATIQDEIISDDESLEEQEPQISIDDSLDLPETIPDLQDDLSEATIPDEIISDDESLEEQEPKISIDDSLDLPETIPDLQDNLSEATIPDEIISDDESLEEQEPQISIDDSLDLPETIPDLQDDLSEATILDENKKEEIPVPEIEDLPLVAKTPDEQVQKITLASEDIIELLVGQLVDIEEELVETLAKLINSEADDLLMAVSDYTELVQSIWDAADMANLIGLQEVCTFVNDNVMALGGLSLEERNKTQEILTAWSLLTIAYLQDPANQTQPLINHLQNELWPSQSEIEWLTKLLPSSEAEKEPLPESIVSEPEITSEPIQKITLASEDIIELLVGQLVDIEEELAETLAKLISSEADDLLMAVSDYTELVQSIWDAADMANLIGLQEVCTFVNDNVMALGGLSLEERNKTQEILTAWPLLTIAYLQDPANQTQPLINHLQDALWPSQSEIEWLTKLLPSSETKEESLPVETETTEVKEEISLAEAGTIELIVGQIIDINEELATTANQIIDAEGEDLLLAVSTYTEYVQSIWDVAEMASLTGLQDICTFINNNIMELGGQSAETRNNAKELILAWPELVITYLQTPYQGVDVLLSHLQQWPTPPENVAELKQHLIPTLQIIKLAAPDILELVRSQITDSTEGLSAALEVCMSMENDNPALLEAIEEYTNKVQEIWDVAEMANLGGLQEVCTFINDNLMFASQQDDKLASQPQFIAWPGKVLTYLTTPETGATELVSFLQESTWPNPLEQEAGDKLLIALTTPAANEEPTATLSTEDIPQEIQEAPVTEVLTPLDITVNEDISLGSEEVIEILTGELEFAKEDLAKELERIMTSDNTEAVENYTEQVQRLNVAAEMVGLEGLQAVCSFIVDNVMATSTIEMSKRATARTVLEGWPTVLLGYFTSPTTGVLPLVDYFRLSTWQQPLNDETAKVLATQLMAGSSAEEEEEDEANNRQTQATPEDVALNIPEDINPELLEAYLQETPQHAQDFSEAIQNIIQGADVSEIERAQRIAHTLKGSSNIIGIKGIASMGHHLEDTLEYLAKHKVTPPPELTDTMVEAADCLEMMVDFLLGQDDAPEQSLQVLQSVLDWANRIDKGKLDAPPAPTKPAVTPAADTPAPAKTESKAPAKKAAKPAATGEVEQFLRVPTKTVDELMRLVGELSISLGQIQERMRHVVQSTRLLTEQDLVLHEKTFELENLVDIRGITGMGSNVEQVNKDDENFDPLEFEEYNELHSVAHSFIESIADNRELTMTIQEDLVDLDTMLIRQERLNKEFQTNIMTTRMVPASTLLSKLQRNVRQTCRSTGKKADLNVSGTDILMDSDVVNNLGDPLQHILRNSIDHGLESTDERVMLGKPEIGNIQLSFYREGNNIVVKCQDDGQGLNYTNIRYSAIKRGLITEEQELSEKELARLILMSGFSTKSGVTQMSGRGVGMDVVHTSIRDMKGTLDLMSETGKGTTMLIKLPMTLVTVHVLLVRIGDFRFGIPSNTLERALAAGISEFYQVGEETSLKIDKNVYALKYLANLLNIKGDKEAIDELKERPIVLVHEETGISAVIVDELMDTHDLVMKNMGNYVKEVRGVSGASILGDGSLVPLLDIPELLRSPAKFTMRPVEQSGDMDEEASSGIPNIMIVDDSLSVRKSLSLLVEDAGFEVLLAKDGVEAIEVMNQSKPDVMLVDMEMPRMNGLELTAHVRANQATQSLPIFMITSRTTEKHKEQAKSAGVSAYLTKPYQETELLDLIDKALAG